MNKKFEYVDDNPGAYFGMLVEEFEDKDEFLKESHNNIENIVTSVNKFPYSGKIVYMNEIRTPLSLSNDFNRINEFKVDVSKCKSLDELVHILKKYFAYDGSPINLTVIDDNNKYTKLSFKVFEDGETKIIIFHKNYQSNESLTEDKFVPQDKMSKKAQKELNDKKRGTWGNTNPVTRVQPNKKAYDRKRDKKADLDESKKLNESSDGWDESKLDELSEILDEIYNLQYEVKNTVRGAYTNAHTYEELGYYVHNLGSNLMDVGDEIMEMEEEEEDDEDED